MPRYEIQIKVDGVYYILDTYEYEPVSLQYQISDITEVDKRKANYSKTIKLPLTGLNRQIFTDLFNLASDTSYNPSRKAECWIMVNTIPVFEGNLQVKSATIDDIANKTEVEVVVYSENDDFFKNIGEKYLKDLDLSDLNHKWGTASILGSWNATASWSNVGYYYPMIDYGRDWDMSDLQGLGVADFFPAVYVKKIWNKIFSDAGYSYESNFLNSARFENLICPFGKDKLQQNLVFEDVQFWVGMQATQSFTQSLQVFFNPNYPPLKRIDKIGFNNETTAPYGDPGGNWNTTTFEYTNTTTSEFTQRFEIKLDIQERAPSTTANPYGRYVRLRRSRNPITGATATNAAGVLVGYPIPIMGQNELQLNLSIAGAPYSAVANAAGVLVNVNVMSDVLSAQLGGNYLPIQPGEKVWCEYRRDLNTCPPNFVHMQVLPTSWIKNAVTNEIPSIVNVLQPGSTINFNAFFQENIKQKDFVLGIIKMFNLLLEPSKIWSKTLIIEPRDDYYASGAVEDWTNKIDLNVPIEEEILSDLQYKTIRASYAGDSDYYNVDYKNRANQNYGEYREEIDNDFIINQLDMKVVFGSTPLVNVMGSKQFVIPKIGKVDGNGVFSRTATNLRILTKYAGNLLPLTTPSDYWKFNGQVFGNYPYAGHFDNPQDPSFDLNWGQTIGLYYEDLDVTNNNLIELYWRKQFAEVNDKNAKLIRCEMRLTPSDIYNFRFNKSIFLDIEGNGQYYRVQSITNYDPGKTTTCQVELLKIKSFTFKPRKKTIRQITPIASMTSFNSGTTNVVPSSTNVVSGKGNNVQTGPNVITGKGNNTNVKKSAVFGDDNTMLGSGEKNMIIGDGNVINGGDVFIKGNYVSVVEGVQQTTVLNGYNLVVNQSNIVVAGAPMPTFFNYIDCGKDMVLWFYSLGDANYVDASIDSLSNWGSRTIWNYVDAGLDDILAGGNIIT